MTKFYVVNPEKLNFRKLSEQDIDDLEMEYPYTKSADGFYFYSKCIHIRHLKTGDKCPRVENRVIAPSCNLDGTDEVECKYYATWSAGGTHGLGMPDSMDNDAQYV